MHRPIIAFFLIFILILPACNWKPEREPGYLILRLNTNPTTLDPAHIVDVTGGTLAAKLFNGLVQFGEDLSIRPDIAKGWEISPDQRVYLFHLRDDVLFSTGEPVRAQDVKYSFERVLSPETRSPMTWVLDRIDEAESFMTGRAPEISGIAVLDDHTLKIRLKAPFAPFLGLLAMPPASIVPRAAVERWKDDFASHPVGTGPYQMTQWTPGQSIRLAANPSYFGEKPGLRGILYRIIPEDLTAVAEFETGGLDAIAIPAAEYRRYLRDPIWSSLILSQTGLNTYYVGLNCSRPPLSDYRVRQAIQMAIDVEKILHTIYENRGDRALGPVPPALWNSGDTILNSVTAETSIVSPEFRYDPARAKELLKEAGYPNGFSMTFTITPDPEIVDVVETIQSFLKAVSIHAEIRQLEWSAFKKATVEGKTDAFYLSWWADYPDPENFLFPVFHSSNRGAGGNRSHFSDPVTDRWIESAQNNADPEQRMNLYRQAERRIVEQSPWIFLWHKKDFVVHQPWVKGLRLYPIYSMDKGLGITLLSQNPP
ncbi:MAG: ABC transporter substrate-binding protein [Nitrospirae bacterium]|nr:ABC transporter substrate-binding protein [Nitrospirota bacterium]